MYYLSVEDNHVNSVPETETETDTETETETETDNTTHQPMKTIEMEKTAEASRVPRKAGGASGVGRDGRLRV